MYIHCSSIYSKYHSFEATIQKFRLFLSLSLALPFSPTLCHSLMFSLSLSVSLALTPSSVYVHTYRVAMISRLLKIIGLLSRI